MNIAILIQARLDSKRLPRKILKDINGKPLYKRLYERLENIQPWIYYNPLPIYWCIPEEDKELKAILESEGYNVFCGDYDNVHKRLLDCADKYDLDHIIRVTGDNPLTDRLGLHILVTTHMINNNDYTYTTDMPKGTKCEVVRVETMKEVCNEPEHLTFDFLKYKNKQDVKTGVGYSNLRLTVDYPSDLMRIRQIYKMFGDQPCVQDVISTFYCNDGRMKSSAS